MPAIADETNGMTKFSTKSSRKPAKRATCRKSPKKGTGAVQTPAEKAQATRSANQRAALRRKAEEYVAKEIAFIDFAGFREMEKERAKEPDLPVGQMGKLPKHVTRDLPSHLVRYCEVPLLTAAQERDLFCWMNYYLYRANATRSRLYPSRPSAKKLNDMDQWLGRANEIRNHIVRANTRLIISIAKKLANELNPFDELLSEGTNCLINVVAKFDFSRGYRFSTYATRSVQRELWRLMQRGHRDRQRYATGVIETFDAEQTEEPDEAQITERTWKQLSRKINNIISILDEREQFIVRSRYGMISDKPRTFQSLGDELGVCKERVRQLEIRALKKLYAVAKESGLEKFELSIGE